MLEQHKMVYNALAHWINKEIHAISIETSKPSTKKVRQMKIMVNYFKY